MSSLITHYGEVVIGKAQSITICGAINVSD